MILEYIISLSFYVGLFTIYCWLDNVRNRRDGIEL